MRVVGACLAVVFCLGLGATGVAEQPSCHMSAEVEEPTAPEQLPPPVRMTGIGNGHIEITSSSAEAKVWFDQGLNLMHDFWDYESSRAFEESIRLDPKCAMCWWGLAQEMRGDNIPRSEELLKHAEMLAKDKKNTTEAERLYIKALAEKIKEHSATRSGHGANTGGEVGTKPIAYKDSKETKTLRRLVALKPEDVQAKIFLAESMMDGYDADGQPKAGSVQGQVVLAALLAVHPEDTAANHYWIHALEPSLTPERALVSAKRLGPLTGSSGHMVHMPGHIYYRMGDYETARVSFENSMKVDEEYMKTQGVPVEADWNYVHNLMYLIADLLEAGRIAEATEVSAKLNAAHGRFGVSLYPKNVRDQMTRLSEDLPVALRAGEWSRAVELLEKSAPEKEWVNLVALRGSLLDYTRGMAALQDGDVAGAEKFSAELEQRVSPAANARTAAKVKKGTAAGSGGSMAGVAMPGMMAKKDALPGPLHSYLGVASLELKAAVEMAQGQSSEAEATFAKAASAERELGYLEPPFYIRPVSETRGDALMRAKRYEEARQAYEAALVERPNSGYPLYGIAEADAAAGDVAEARTAYAAMLKAWAAADSGLPQMVAARAWMEGHAAVTGE